MLWLKHFSIKKVKSQIDEKALNTFAIEINAPQLRN